MTEESLITPEIQAMLGREEDFPGRETVDMSMIRRYVRATEDDNRLYVDEEYARKSKWGGVIAPPSFVFEVANNTWQDIGQDGRPTFRVTLPPPLTRIARGGNEYEFHQPVRPGDVVSIKRKITDIYERQGRSGKLVFVISEMRYTNQKNELLAINRETLIFFK